MTDTTRLLQQAVTGDAIARDALFAAACPVLEDLARARLRDGGRDCLLDTYFGGYSEREIAETLEVTQRSVLRLWLKARLMLRAAME